MFIFFGRTENEPKETDTCKVAVKKRSGFWNGFVTVTYAIPKQVKIAGAPLYPVLLVPGGNQI